MKKIRRLLKKQQRQNDDLIKGYQQLSVVRRFNPSKLAENRLHLTFEE
jgi:hypothetical protein